MSIIGIPVNLIDETVNISAIIFGRQLISEVDIYLMVWLIQMHEELQSTSTSSDLLSKAYNGLIIGDETYYILFNLE